MSYRLFGEFLVQAEAKRQMEPEYTTKDSETFALATAMCRCENCVVAMDRVAMEAAL